jgi:hypothetical protein
MQNMNLILSKGLAVLCALLVSILYANSSSAQDAQSPNIKEENRGLTPFIPRITAKLENLVRNV